MGAEERRLGGQLGGDAHEAGLVVDRGAVAGLDLDRRDAGRAAPRPGGLAPSARSSSSDAARVASIVVLMPPASYGRPGHAGGELGGPVAGEHEVGVAVDEARDHAAPAGVDALVGGRAPARCRRRRRASPSIDDVASVQLAVVGVRHQPPDAVDDDAWSRAAPRRSSAATSSDVCGAVAHDDAAADDDVVDVGGGGREHDAVPSASAGAGAGGADRVQARPS